MSREGGGFKDSMKFLDSVRHLLFLLLTALFLYYLYRSIKQYLSKPIGLAISEEEEDAFTYKIVLKEFFYTTVFTLLKTK